MVIGYFIEVDLKYPDDIKAAKTRNFTFAPQIKICNINDFCEYMKKNKTL